MVHRLDKDTSGLLIVARATSARTRRSSRSMAAAHQARVHHAAWGTLPQSDGTIDAPLGRHVRDRKRMCVHTTGRIARSRISPCAERLPGYTLLDVRLETGRTHQIRVHFAALGYPVAGDPTYGDGRAVRPALGASSCTPRTSCSPTR